MHWASLGVLAGVAGRGFRPRADRPVEDVCDWGCCGCCPLLPLVVGFCSFEFVLFNDVEYLYLVDVVFLFMILCKRPASIYVSMCPPSLQETQTLFIPHGCCTKA
jgi:hypothetical protein